MPNQTISQALTVRELTIAVTTHMKDLGYRPGTIKSYGRIFSDLVDYCKACDTDVFTLELGRQFLWERYGMRLGDQDLSNKVHRVIQMLTEFQQHGKISKRYPILPKEVSNEYKPLIEGAVADFQLSIVAESTINHYRNFLRRFEVYLRDRGVMHFSQLKLYHVNAYLESLSGLSENTVRAAVGNMRRFFDYAHDNGYHHTSFSAALPTVRYRMYRRLPETFTVEEIERILENIDRNNPLGKRNYAITLLVARLGLRLSDVLSLQFQSVHWQAKMVSIQQQKTGNPLELPLPEDVGWAMIDYMKHGRPKTSCEFIFVRHNAPYDKLRCDFTKLISGVIQKAGIKYDPNKMIGMHCFRHSIATSLLGKDTTLSEISQILGHESLANTERYISLNVDMLRQCALEVNV